jgi:predicted regulator of Ras-like GTPase activity (Roadblock/LC7/MglB family)
MINPLVDLVNKVRQRFFASGNGTPVPQQAVRTEKPAGERLSKTVMPNSTRTIAPQDPLQAAAANATAPSAITAVKTGPRMISLGATQPPRQAKDLPPAIALALEPKVERAISLQLSDILDQIPAGYIKSEESFDPTRRVLLKAVEIEKGMAARSPSVALTSIYEQIPEIFLRSVAITDTARIALPFEKVLDQFNRVQVRRDQIRDSSIPQVDTPFLAVAMEESEKFGTTLDPLQTSALPPVKVQPATAEALAAAEPEAAESVAGPPLSLAKPESLLLERVEDAATAESPRSTIVPPEPRVHEEPPHNFTPARIPFHLPPKGTGAPASERVPASSGPPVLPSVAPSSPKLPPPPRNPYESVPFDQMKFSETDNGLSSERVAELEKPRKRKTIESTNLDLITAPSPDMASKVEEKIELPLRIVLQNLPAFQRQGDPSLAPEDVKISLQFAPLAEQLATGRVTVSPKVFQEAIPTEYRYLFHLDEAETPVVLPLQEVLKNVPSAALQMRTDQEALVENETIETPFSIQAKEDARRFSGEEPPTIASLLDRPRRIETKPVEKVEKVDAKQVVARATKLPGINGCAITFADGLSLAGNLPAAISADGLCAVAPTLLQRIEKHMLDTKLGPLNSMTLQCASSAVTFFMHGNVCLSALHTTEGLSAETRRQLARMVDELSQTFSQPEISHVDH